MYDLSEMAKKLSITTVGLVDIGSMATLLGVRQERNLYKIIAKLIASNWLTKIERGKYQINSIKIHDFEMANFVYQPSYVSFESALNYWGILSQFPFEITSLSLIEYCTLFLLGFNAFERSAKHLASPTLTIGIHHFAYGLPRHIQVHTLGFDDLGLRHHGRLTI